VIEPDLIPSIAECLEPFFELLVEILFEPVTDAIATAFQDRFGSMPRRSSSIQTFIFPELR